ncbi:DUF2946 family protein [uncultured Caballeronia sp.]|jgi:Protein of unknown function (DUF2946)|uniref:DUF2946 domain-containing protein n=1 Tax=uncultured Caballeronia sp. TaxID=1827198 RepID=UPI001576E62A
MRRSHVRKFGSFIGKLAILMMTLAPAISQTLASRARTNSIFNAHCSAITESQTLIAANHQQPHHSMAGHWDACGYCNFAVHSPAAPPSIDTLPTHRAAAALAVNAPALFAAPYAPLFAAQPRAPPFFI